MSGTNGGNGRRLYRRALFLRNTECWILQMNFIHLLETTFAENPVPTGDFDPVFAFSIHKAGSSLMHGMVNAVCEREGIPHLNVPGRLFELGVPDRTWVPDARISNFFSGGRVYFGFRELPRGLLNERVRLEQCRAVLLVRDPRDALVSQYYSFGGKYSSHVRSRANPALIAETMKKTADLDIDEYVVQAAREYLRKLQNYEKILGYPFLAVRRYEDVYYDKRQFLLDMFVHFGITVSWETIESVAQISDVRPEFEDVSQHIRKGTPGDHREKLSRGTIAVLNRIFRETARKFGYDL